MPKIFGEKFKASQAAPEIEEPMPHMTLHRAVVLVALLALSGCGADGAPEAPAKTGLTISGDVAVGVTVQ